MARTKEPDVLWRPHEGPQMAFLSSRVFDLGYGGAWGGGKTDALIYGGIRFSYHPLMRAILLRRTFPELRELMDRCHLIFPKLGANWVASEKLWRFPSGGSFEFGYCGSWEEAQQYLTREFTYVGYDQVEQLVEERTWAVLVGRVRSKTPEILPMARCSFNPGGVGHGWVKKRYVKKLPWDGTPVTIDEFGNQRAFIFATLKDNPSLKTNDPGYEARIKAMPDQLRRQAEGDWSAGEGVAFEELTETSHLARDNQIQPYWRFIAAFDWGYGHRWAFGLGAVKPDGVVRVIDSVMGRRLVPEEIVERVRDLLQTHGLRFSDLQYTVAGSDVKIQDRARGNWGPSVQEQFLTFGWPLINADQNRIAGYQNYLHYLHQKMVEFADTPGNRMGIDQVMGLANDPDSPNDVLKVDFDPATGEGGDDWYDMSRYLLMSRPIASKLPVAKSNHIETAEPLAKLMGKEERKGVPWAAQMPTKGFIRSPRTHTETA